MSAVGQEIRPARSCPPATNLKYRRSTVEWISIEQGRAQSWPFANATGACTGCMQLCYTAVNFSTGVDLHRHLCPQRRVVSIHYVPTPYLSPKPLARPAHRPLSATSLRKLDRLARSGSVGRVFASRSRLRVLWVTPTALPLQNERSAEAWA